MTQSPNPDLVAAERAKPAASDREAARTIIAEWLNHDLTSWLDTELAELRELIAAALAERGRVERERAAEIADEVGTTRAADRVTASYIAAAIRNRT